MTPLTLHQLESRDTPAPLQVVAYPSGQVRIGTALVTPFDGYAGDLDVTTDGDRVWVGAGPGGGPRIATFGADGSRAGEDFFAFEPSFRGGVEVAAGAGLLYVAPRAGGAPVVATFMGPTEVSRQYVGDPDSRAGVSDLAAYVAPQDAPITTGDPAGLPIYVAFEDYTPHSEQAEILDRVAAIFAPVGGFRFTTRRPTDLEPWDYGIVRVTQDAFAAAEKGWAGMTAVTWVRSYPTSQERAVYVRPIGPAAQTASTIAHEVGNAEELAYTTTSGNIMCMFSSPANTGLTADQVAELRTAQTHWMGRA